MNIRETLELAESALAVKSSLRDGEQARCEKALRAVREALHPLRENEQLAEGVLRLTKTVRYLVGIAERGEGRPMLDDETAEQFVLRYVQRLENALAEARTAKAA